MHWREQIGKLKDLLERIGRPVRLMEVCGTHTVSACRSGLRSLLPEGLSLLAGPGCPVCVTAPGYVDRAVALARLPGTTIATFGDMLRVPGTCGSLERAKAQGGTVRIVYSPEDALHVAGDEPDRQVVFLGVGFETTAPSVAWTIREAARKGIGNYRVLSAHKVMPPAMMALLGGGDVRIDGFLCPGHVSAIIGAAAYRPLVDTFHVPCVIAGFEPEEMAAAMEEILAQLAAGRPAVANRYERAVAREENGAAMGLLREVFQPADVEWRGLGIVPGSGLEIRPAFRDQDAAVLCAGLALPEARSPAGCICGDVLRGAALPGQCPLFGGRCTPASPVGACMVSSEGACAAFFRYRGGTA